MMEKSIEIVSTLDEMPKVISFIEEELENLGASMKVQTQIDVAMDELLCNVIKYAYYPNTGNINVILKHDDGENAVYITIIDSGIEFNPLNTKEPDITLSANDRPIGGLGIFIVKKTMDDVSYKYENGCNILTIKKKL